MCRCDLYEFGGVLFSGTSTLYSAGQQELGTLLHQPLEPDDQIVPIADSALLSAKLLKKGTLKVYEKFPHGMCATQAETVNPELLAFIAG